MMSRNSKPQKGQILIVRIKKWREDKQEARSSLKRKLKEGRDREADLSKRRKFRVVQDAVLMQMQ